MGRKLTHILDIPFDVISMNQAVEKCIQFLEDGAEHIICTPNPEIVMEAQNDRELKEILKAADMVVPDGIGIVWASKYSEKRIKERIAGYDLTQNIFNAVKDKDVRIFFFGGAPGVANKAAKKMCIKYPNLSIAGVRNGYFTSNEESLIIEEIKKQKTDILLVGLGAPRQEKWIYNNIFKTGAKISIGVGGSFDVMAGNVKRAPAIFQKFGLEWFYRLISQPTRLKRMMRLPKFALKVLERKNNSDKRRK